MEYIVGGNYCPKCKEEGGMFHYKKLSYSDAPSFYLCENCLVKLTPVEYDELLKQNPPPDKNSTL